MCMFPISDSIKTFRFPYFNTFIIFLTVYVFLQEFLAPDATVFINNYALIPVNVNMSDFRTFAPFVTAIFLHGGFIHILSNMWFLWVFGDAVEIALPPPLFLLLYIAAGVVGNFIQYSFMPGSQIPMLGASGAVAGILGSYYILFTYSKVKTLVFIFIFITIIEISAPLMLGYWFALQLFSGVISFPGTENQGGIAFFAHIAGFITGMVIASIIKNTPLVKSVEAD